MRRALVTGHEGFLGRHFCAALENAGWQLDTVGEGLAGRDARWYFRTCPGPVPDLVVHCAAGAAYRRAIDTAPVGQSVNFELDAALFSWAVRARPGRVLYLSSSAAYPVALQTGDPARRLAEDDIDLARPAEPDALYGWCKLTGERLAQAARQAGVAVTVVRPFSGYGPGQGANWPVGAFIQRAMARADPFTVWGTGRQVRDWIHVDDLVAGALAVVEAGEDGPVNLCTGTGTPMGAVAALVCKALGHSPTLAADESAPAGVQFRVGDPTRMLEFYQPRYGLAEGIAATIW